jgi:hypothetical protein
VSEEEQERERKRASERARIEGGVVCRENGHALLPRTLQDLLLDRALSDEPVDVVV